MGDILVKEGHLFSIVFISKFLGCWFKWQFKKKWYSSCKILQVVQSLCWWGILIYLKRLSIINTFRKLDKLSKLTDNSKLYLYNKIKHDIVLEEYLIKEKNFKNRQLIAKFRTSDHCLQIETGWYINIPHQQRLCTTCNILEDEHHFFLNCHLNQQPRNLLINTIENKCPSFTNMSPMNKLDYILNPTSDLLLVVCTFIKQSLDLRW
jgi:hypothetical protein